MSHSRWRARAGLAWLAIAVAAAPARADDESAELAAFQRAAPVFARCTPCHSQRGAHADPEALAHLDMTWHPMTGEHARTAGAAIREVLGLTGQPASMPKDAPGAIQGEPLALAAAWADAFDQAYPAPTGAAAADDMADMPGMDHHTMAGMPGDAYPLPFAVPRESLIPGRPGMAGGYHIMVNGFAHLLDPGLGAHRIDNPGAGGFDGGRVQPLLTDDWVMGYWRHPHGWVEAMVMLNFEPLSVGKRGVPEVGQSGEELWDAQHAHQLLHQAMISLHPLSGLSAGRVTMGREGAVDLALFFGQGSATIGPPVFMHRASNPSPTVPRKHHKGENPHETFPVIGASFRWRGSWLEASAFSALELTPDDSRLYPHAAAPRSFAARFRQDVGGWAELQLSGERLRDQGHGEPDADQVSASAYGYGHLRCWRVDGLLDWALDRPDQGRTAQAATGELAVRDPGLRDTFWLRSEFNQREEAAGGVSSPWLFQSLGFERQAVRWRGLALGLYGEATFGHIPDSQAAVYGTRSFVTLDVGLRLSGMWMLDSSGHRMQHQM